MNADEDEIRKGLRRAYANRKGGRRQFERGTADLKEWAARADEAGIKRAEIARLAGVSREGLYAIMRWGGR